MPARSLDGRWFGAFEIPPGARGRWEIGALAMCVERAVGEWRIWHSHAPVDPGLPDRALFAPDLGPTPEQALQRYVVDDLHPELRLTPLLPDRSVVARPVSPLFVPAGESARLYVGIPLWLRLEVGSRAPYQTLLELPTVRLSDTWFGLTPMVGELCYALKTRCRLALDPAQQLPYRATVPLVIRNRFREPLALERVNVPVRQLSLYAAPGGALWANELTLERDEEGSLAALRFGPAAPVEAAGAEEVARPRDPTSRRAAIRSFSALFQS